MTPEDIQIITAYAWRCQKHASERPVGYGWDSGFLARTRPQQFVDTLVESTVRAVNAGRDTIERISKTHLPTQTETPMNPEIQRTTEELVKIAQTKKWRKELDDVLQHIRCGTDRDYTGIRAPDAVLRQSRERSLAITKVQEAIMWLGMDLKAMNTPNPYPESYNPESPRMEPTADNLKL